MRVLLINTSERTGGAAVAASRLMESLNNNGIKAKMLVRDKQTDKISVVELPHSWKNIWRFVWERFLIWKANKFKKNNLFAVDIANTGTDITALPEFEEADIIHLHWINQGMLSLNCIKKILNSGKPIVWTMHDMWPFTGICHYSGTCIKYKENCHNCPQLYGDGKAKDISYKIFNKKSKIYQQGSITFVACSQWLERLAKESPLLIKMPITSIPNPINTNLFKPQSKREIRDLHHLPLNAKLLLFGSVKITDKRKGVDYLIESCNIIKQKYPDLADKLGVVVFGQQSEQLKSLIPFPVYVQSYVTDEKELVRIYNAVDLYVIPSLQDNLPNTIMEAMACGIPCVGFNVGGIPEMIDHLHNGYVAEYKSAEDFANGINWALNESEYSDLSEEAVRKVISNYSESAVAKKYIEIYNKNTTQHA
jgi:glycosyltransferase involved in cell wall biosynthesis